MGWLVYVAVAVNLSAALGALIVPFVARRLKGPRFAALVSKLCTGTALAGAVASIVSIRLAEVPGTRQYLFVVVPLTILAGMSCVYWTVVGLIHGRPKDLKAAAHKRAERALRRG
jgi:hypothetical protein